MKATGCAPCRVLRTVFLIVLLGAVAGFAVLAAGGSQESSMMATFAAAIAPLLWQARNRRSRPDDTG